MNEQLPTAPEIRAGAHNVVEWYRREVASRTHDLAFAHCALHEARQATALVQDELIAVRGELESALAQHEQEHASAVPSLDDPQFGAWVVEHWAAIEDARIAHAVENPGQPQVVEQP